MSLVKCTSPLSLRHSSVGRAGRKGESAINMVAMPVAASEKCVAINAGAITPTVATKVVVEVARLSGRNAQCGQAGFHMSVRQPHTDIWKFWMGVLRRQQLHDLNLDLVELLHLWRLW